MAKSNQENETARSNREKKEMENEHMNLEPIFY